jgi:hypothetical protein
MTSRNGTRAIAAAYHQGNQSIVESNRILGVSTAQWRKVDLQAQLQLTRFDAEGADRCCFGIEQSIFAAPHTPTSGYSPCCAGNQTASESCTCEVGESVGIPDHERRGGLGVAQGFETAVVDCEPKDGVARNWRCMTQSECDDHFRPHVAGMRVHVSPRRRGERSPQTLCVRAQNIFLD